MTANQIYASVVFSPTRIPDNLRPLDSLLQGLGYTPIARREIIEHVRKHRTSEGCQVVETEDGEAVEAAVPMDAAWYRTEWNGERWTTATEEA